ncbi:hypothetical protein Tco_0905458 [Tanacetum coccineum]
MLLTDALESGATLDAEQLAFLENNGDTFTPVQASQEIPSPTAFQTDDLDAFDSNCDDAPSAKVILMANLSSYDSDVLSEVIVDRNAKVTDFENQMHSLKLLLNATVESHKTLSTIVECLKKESKKKEDKYLDEFINLQIKNKALENVVSKMGHNYGVTCEDEAKRRNSGAKTKTFEENYYLLLYVVKMDDPNITMEEYIRLEEEKAHRRGKCLIGKLITTILNDSLTSNETPSCEPTVSSLNDEIDFRTSFDEFNDEDYMVVFDKNSFSYKIFSTNDLKKDSENDNEKVNKPLFPSPEPTVSCLNDLDFFKDFENEFPAIVYNVL